MKKTVLMIATAMSVAMALPALADHHGGKMKKIDTDGNGSISKVEFLNAQEARFAEIDTDGNGEISKEEMKAKKEAKRAKMKEMKEKRAAE